MHAIRHKGSMYKRGSVEGGLDCYRSAISYGDLRRNLCAENSSMNETGDRYNRRLIINRSCFNGYSLAFITKGIK